MGIRGLILTLALGLLAAGLTGQDCVRAQTAQPPLFDPFDAPTNKALDWANIEQAATWVQAPDAGPGDQPGGTKGFFPFRAIKMIKTTLDSVPADLSLLIAKDGSGRHEIIMTVISTGTGDCAYVRGQTVQAYGTPAATRLSTNRAVVGAQTLTFADDVGQWPAGGTMITQACGTITLGAKTIYTITVDLEPVATARPLTPFVRLACPDLDLGPAPTAPAGQAEAATLTLDPRVEAVHGADGKVIALLRLSAAEYAFDLPGGRTIEINRKTGAYIDRATQPPQARRGVCRTLASAD